MYEIDGTEALGSYLRICPCSERAPELSECSFQWYRLASEAGKKELISGILDITRNYDKNGVSLYSL